MDVTIKNIKTFCDEHGYSFSHRTDKYKYQSALGRITITKKRSCKIIIEYQTCYAQLWDPNRMAYTSKDKKYIFSNFGGGVRWVKDPTIPCLVMQNFEDVIQFLEECPQYNKKETDIFEIKPQEFSQKTLTLFTNGIVRLNNNFTSAFVVGVVEINNRGILQEAKQDSKNCWFLIDGKSNCNSTCKGQSVRVIFDGDEKWIAVSKSGKKYVVENNSTYALSKLDKYVIEEALKLYLENENE